ncbi:MAG: hypothetical protein ACHQQS_08625 [Thermoanaerobaculales bacterium]
MEEAQRNEVGGRQYTEREVSLADVIAFFRRNYILVFGTALACGLLTAFIVIAFVGHSYEASATLAIVPPRYSSELKPGTLTVKGYQTLLESDAVIAETKRRLVQKGLAKPDDEFDLGKELETRIFVARRAEEINLAPMLQVVARGETPEQAAAIANTWAQVFLERTQELMAGSTSSTVKFIEHEFPNARERLIELENTRLVTASTYQKNFEHATTAWNEKVIAYNNETADLTAAYRSETRRLLEDYKSQHNLETRRVQLRSLRTAYADLQDEQARVSALLQQKQLQVDALRLQIKQTAQFLTLEKAITDDALWQAVAVGKAEEKGANSIDGRHLRTQEVNPVYTTIASNLSQTETDLNALTPRAHQLEQRLAEMSVELNTTDAGLSTDEAGLEKLQRERDAGLSRLEANRANDLDRLTRERQADLDGIKREWDTRLAQADRDIGQEKDLFADLAKKDSQALLAKAQQDVEDVRLGAPAVAPDRPQRRGGATKSLLALVIGGLVGTGIAIVREA